MHDILPILTLSNLIKAIAWTGGPFHQQRDGATISAIHPSTTSDATREDTTGVHALPSNAPPIETAAPQQEVGGKTLESCTTSPSDEVVVSEQAVAGSAANNSGTSLVTGLNIQPSSRKDRGDDDLHAEATNVSTLGSRWPAAIAQNEQTQPPESPQSVVPISTERNQRLWKFAIKAFVHLRLHVEGSHMDDVQRKDMVQKILRSNQAPIPSTWGPNMRSGVCPLGWSFHGPYRTCGTWQNRARQFQQGRCLETTVSQNPISKSDEGE